MSVQTVHFFRRTPPPPLQVYRPTSFKNWQKAHVRTCFSYPLLHTWKTCFWHVFHIFHVLYLKIHVWINMKNVKNMFVKTFNFSCVILENTCLGKHEKCEKHVYGNIHFIHENMFTWFSSLWLWANMCQCKYNWLKSCTMNN